MIGKTVSHYRVLASVGSGGTSVVYKAEDMRLGRFVALKFLLEKFCEDRALLEQFRQEARTASALNHPGICTIHDIDQDRDRPFIVMEYLEGQTLREKFRKCGLTMEEAITYGIQIAEALGKAHAAGIVHRDISPANLFITLDGRVKLLDFGIAKLASPECETRMRPSNSKSDRMTLTGTIHYMSPEQALSLDVDGRSDIFSLGVVLYEILGGRRPFRGPGVTAIINQVIKATPEQLRVVAPDVPVIVQRAVHRCMEKRPEHRYQTAAELREDLKLAEISSPFTRKTLVKPSASSTLDQTLQTAITGETVTDWTGKTAGYNRSYSQGAAFRY